MVDYFFFALSLITIGAAVLALESRELVYGAVALAVSLLGVAGLFILLDATFIAMLQILVFVGAISVLIIFVVMLVRREKWVTMPGGHDWFAGILVAILFVAGVGYLAMNSGMASLMPNPSYSLSYKQIGTQILTDYWFALQVLGLVLAASIMGALTLAKLEGPDE